jgi:hypothetical protein
MAAETRRAEVARIFGAADRLTTGAARCGSQQGVDDMGQAAKVVNEYLEAFYAGDVERAKRVVADDFSFKGPFVETHTKEAFFESAARLAPIVRGHRLLRQWEEGHEVASVYELRLETPAGSGTVLMSEWHTVRGERLSAGTAMFDSAAFRTLVPAR